MCSPPHHDDDRIQAVIGILEKSLQAHPDEEIPPLPDDLRERLQRQYGEEQAPAPRRATAGWWERLRGLVVQPAFSGVMAALVLAAVLLGFLSQNGAEESAEQMRGAASQEEATTVILLYQLTEEQQAAILASGYFERGSLQVVDEATVLAEWVAREGQSIVVDGAEGEIRNEEGHSLTLPVDEAAVADVIVELLGS
ncbi:hypothetical protein [Roseibacillus ishigakijimensis]|nr:hypothetical protein [Roseibacillus ishigakijimensis]